MERGCILGLLGRNGAGKITPVKALVGLIALQEGEILVAGGDPGRQRQIRDRIDVVHQHGGFESMLSGCNNLRVAGKLCGLGNRAFQQQVDSLAERLGCIDFLRSPATSLSGGQAKKLQIVRALLHRPAMLFLDEPTAGLDVETRQAFYALIQDLALTQDLTVVWTSHYLEGLWQVVGVR
ncbi:ATP-binding cassette domain-containing protein [Deinococcus sp.]|uniref:ATP-binding cassette domain-containing protein n=1 Tax=Deinococcus sp. TaxID=47478 RepID=UPI003CC58A34